MNETNREAVFPLTVTFADGEKMEVRSVGEAERDLEWIDTDDAADPVTVLDHLGRPVHLKVEALRVVRLELKEPAAP